MSEKQYWGGGVSEGQYCIGGGGGGGVFGVSEGQGDVPL